MIFCFVYYMFKVRFFFLLNYLNVKNPDALFMCI